MARSRSKGFAWFDVLGRSRRRGGRLVSRIEFLQALCDGSQF